MTPLLTINLLRALFVTFATCVGLMIGDEIARLDVARRRRRARPSASSSCWRIACCTGLSLRVFSSATFGLLVGFIFSQLLLASNVLAAAPPQTQWVVGLIVYATFGYLGMMLAIRSNRDEFSLIIPYVRFRQATVQDAPLLIDSNIIIDGRLPELCAHRLSEQIAGRARASSSTNSSGSPIRRDASEARTRSRRARAPPADATQSRRSSVTIHESERRPADAGRYAAHPARQTARCAPADQRRATSARSPGCKMSRCSISTT